MRPKSHPGARRASYWSQHVAQRPKPWALKYETNGCTTIGKQMRMTMGQTNVYIHPHKIANSYAVLCHLKVATKLAKRTTDPLCPTWVIYTIGCHRSWLIMFFPYVAPNPPADFSHHPQKIRPWDRQQRPGGSPPSISNALSGSNTPVRPKAAFVTDVAWFFPALNWLNWFMNHRLPLRYFNLYYICYIGIWYLSHTNP